LSRTANGLYFAVIATGKNGRADPAVSREKYIEIFNLLNI